MCESIASFGISSFRHQFFSSWFLFGLSFYFLPLSLIPESESCSESAKMTAMEVAGGGGGGGEGLIAGGGPVFPGAGWAYVTVMSNADSKPCWKYNF